MELALTALAGFVAGIIAQAWRTACALECSLWDVLKTGGGPGEERLMAKTGGGPGEEPPPPPPPIGN